MPSLSELPDGLPIPLDDGACQHLLGLKIPSSSLKSTDGLIVDLSIIKGWLVVYCYPLTGQPYKALPEGWNEIPGARGCTPQTCNFRDNYHQLVNLNSQVYGLSSQNSAYQQEVAIRLNLPYALLSDENLNFANALNLPIFEIDSMHLIKRLTLIIFNGIIKHFFYPVFPPDKNADEVIKWLKQNA